LVEENGWSIYNGCMKEDEDGEFTFTGGRENSTIDYAIGREETREKIKSLEIGDRIESDHHPVELSMKGRTKKRRKRRIRREWRGCWNEEGRQLFR